VAAARETVLRASSRVSRSDRNLTAYLVLLLFFFVGKGKEEQ